MAVPAAGCVEGPQVGEQAMHGGVQVNGLLGNVFAERLNFLDGERGSLMRLCSTAVFGAGLGAWRAPGAEEARVARFFVGYAGEGACSAR